MTDKDLINLPMVKEVISKIKNNSNIAIIPDFHHWGGYNDRMLLSNTEISLRYGFGFKKIIEYIFDVDVINVNTLMTPRKKRTVGRFAGYQPQYKKAIITLKDGDSINLFPDM